MFAIICLDVIIGAGTLMGLAFALMLATAFVRLALRAWEEL
jgi:hypothetical protein